MKRCFFLTCLLLLILLSCSNDHYLKPLHDPYFESFKGRNIQYMISFDTNDPMLTDTITFDREGNVIELKSFGLKERRSYDSMNFIQRILRINDTPSNYYIDYYFNKEGQLVQEWRNVNHLNWHLEKSEIGKVSRAILFEVAENGLIVQEIDTAGNELTLLTYNENETLSSKEIFSIAPKRFLRRWDYSYGSPGRLKTISLSGNGLDILTHYYSDGLLDSTIFDTKGYTTKYRYVFY